MLTVLLRKRILKHDYKVVPEKNNNKLLHETELHLFSIKNDRFGDFERDDAWSWSRSGKVVLCVTVSWKDHCL